MVINGRKPRIYHTWAECDAQVNGHPKAKYQGFESLQETKEFQNKNSNDYCAAALTQEYQLQGTGSNFASLPIPPPLMLPSPSQDSENRPYPYGIPYSSHRQMETAHVYSGASSKVSVQPPRDINPRPEHKRKIESICALVEHRR